MRRRAFVPLLALWLGGCISDLESTFPNVPPGPCPVETALFTTSWEDGTDLFNSGGCSTWKGAEGDSFSLQTIAAGVPELDGERLVRYSGNSSIGNEALYVTVAAAPVLYARFMLNVGVWSAETDAYRTIASFDTSGQPSELAATTVCYLRLSNPAGSPVLEMRYFDGAAWRPLALFAYDEAVTYQVEMQYEVAPGAPPTADGKVGLKIWDSSGGVLLSETAVTDHTSTRLPNTFFLGNGAVALQTNETEVYFDAVTLRDDGWVEPLIRP